MKKKVFFKAGILLLSLLLLPGLLGCGAISSLVATPTATAAATPTISPTATATATPTMTPTRVPLQDIATGMMPVVEGQGIPEAGEYRPVELGPRKLIILTTSGMLHEWNSLVPTDWLPLSVEEVELVVLVGIEREIALGTQRYTLPGGGEAPSITRYRFETDVEVREARTGGLLWNGTLRGSLPRPFPQTAPVGLTRLEGTHVDYSQLEAFLCPKIPGQCSSITSMTLEGHIDKVTQVVFSPDGRLLASESWDGYVILWRVTDGTPLHRIWTDRMEGRIYMRDIDFSPDSQTLALSVEEVVELRRVSDGMFLGDLRQHTASIYDVDFSPDGQILASGSEDGTIRLLRVSDETLLHTLESTDSVTDIAFSPDGQILTSASYDGTIHLWSVPDGVLLHILEGHTGPVWSIAFSPNGQTLASASEDGTVRIWFVENGTLMRTLEGHTDWVNQVVFSPNGQVLASNSKDDTVRLWRVADGSPLHTLRTEANRIAFSPDGQFLASTSDDAKVRLWRVSDGMLLYTLEGHTDRVIDVAFSQSGQLATSSEDTTIRLWTIPWQSP